MIFYAIPFGIMFFSQEDYNKWAILATIIAGFIVNTLFLSIEVGQMAKDGYIDYIASPQNWVDIGGFIVYLVFAGFQLSTAFGTNTTDLDGMRFFLIFTVLLKIQFFLRVNSKMGLLVTLIRTCFVDVYFFAVYLMVWLLAMTIAYRVLGMDATGYSQLTDRSFINFFLQVWENSIGNINPPEFVDAHPSPLRVFAVYFMWFSTQFVVLIILLNFLIAVIS